jgi:type III restriction enzyme
LVTINNHEAWSDEIANLLKEILETENTLSWGYDANRESLVFPIYNLQYEPEQTTIEVKREQATEPDIKFIPQEKKTTQYSTFSETGVIAIEIQHDDLIDIDDAVKLMRLFLREKDEKIASAWPKKRLKQFVVDALRSAGQDTTYLSRANFTLLQQGFGPMFRSLDMEHPRMGRAAKDLFQVDLTQIRRQHFSESTLREHGALYYLNEEKPPFSGHELILWQQYQRFFKQFKEYGEEAGDQARAIGSRLRPVDSEVFKTPWNIHFASHEPERRFSDLLFQNADLFDAFIKMPDQGVYQFPYSYKPANTGRTHTINETFNPDYFIRIKDSRSILVVEIKSEGDDSNRNKAKYRDAIQHFATLNTRLKEIGEPWQYYFYFLSPQDYAIFFGRIREGKFDGWKSTLMQSLS